jgi:hypothetical protein
MQEEEQEQQLQVPQSGEVTGSEVHHQKEQGCFYWQVEAFALPCQEQEPEKPSDQEPKWKGQQPMLVFFVT